eukprot:gene13979-21384_t
MQRRLRLVLKAQLAFTLVAFAVWHLGAAGVPAATLGPTHSDALIDCVDVAAEVRGAELPLPATREDINATVEGILKARPHGEGGGRRWGLKHGPVVVLTYTACHGALSQHYGHLSALALARYIEPDVVVLPHARTRKTYGSRNLLGSRDVERENEWHELHLREIYDVASFQAYFPGGTRVFASPAPPTNITLPKSHKAYSYHFTEDAPSRFGLPAADVARVTYKRRRAGWIWKALINKKLRNHSSARVVVVDLGCTDIMVGANPKYGAMREDVVNLQQAHETLRLAPYLVRAADSAVAKIESLPAVRAAAGRWIALHLRVERDMFADKMMDHWWRAYRRSKTSFLDPKPYPIVVASGIFEYLTPAEQSHFLTDYSVRHPLYRVCIQNELPNDVRPWIDYLVLLRGTYFQGHEYSAFSWLVVQQRILRYRRGLATASLVRKRGYNESSPSCCENDRCLAFACSENDGDPPTEMTDGLIDQ